MKIAKKLFKDPIYGYIKIPSDDVQKIIDTPVFQRLRRIVQTSYSPLYPSSGHNRFEHSIGVYHLGNIAGTTLTSEIENDDNLKNLADWQIINKVFLLSCLLHDVGHAPFSHTGEKFYLDETPGKAYEVLHNKLIELVGSNDFTNDVPTEDSKSAAAHEIMSAIVGLQNFSDCFLTSSEKEIFARCITGYTFSTKTPKNSLFNCYITLLNSKVIDVDRLDYLMRDAFFTGFDTVNLDYERLLTHVTITKEAGLYELAYRKGAISVIENFVYAHDSERKWIQNHPSILYDMYIVQHIMSHLDKKLSTTGKKLFSFDSLSESGHILKENTKISLLCDDDIISLMKMHYLGKDELSREYFSRKDRRCTLWKNEAEYKAFVLTRIRGGALTELLEVLKDTEKYVRQSSDDWIIKAETIRKLQHDIDEIKANDKKSTTDAERVDDKTIKEQMKSKTQILTIMEHLQKYAEDKGETCDFIILKADQFYSGFNKVDFSNINIVFLGKDGKMAPKKFRDVVNSLSGDDSTGNDYFYIFYKRSAVEKFDKDEIRKLLIQDYV